MRFILFFSLLFLQNTVAFGQSTSNVTTLPEDNQAARIITYYGIDEDSSPARSVSWDQFQNHMRELKEGDYNVVALPDVIAAYRQKAPLPRNSVILTFDGSEKSVLTKAVPLLKKYKFPFTVFIAPDRVQQDNPRYLNAKDVRKLMKTPLVSFGLHATPYEPAAIGDSETLRTNLNNALTYYRTVLGEQPRYFAFYNGLYDEAYLNILRSYNFDALLGDQSGVMYQSAKGVVQPRFIMTENYADMTRFKMAVNALPFPVTDVSPISTIIDTNSAIIGFTAPSALSLDHLYCFVTGQKKPDVEVLGSRVEIRLRQPIIDARTRMNCTVMATNDDNKNVENHWRWLGFILDQGL